MNNEYLAIDIGGCVNELSSRSYCSDAECFPQKLMLCCNEQVCQGGQVDWTQRYIRTYIFTFYIHQRHGEDFSGANHCLARHKDVGDINTGFSVVDVPQKSPSALAEALPLLRCL